MTIIVNGSNTPTAGAVGYGDGTNLAFTSAGTTGQFLQSNGSSAPSWVGAPASAITLISTQTASNSASLSWTGLTADKYMLTFEYAYPSVTSASFLGVQFGVGATPTYNTSSYRSYTNIQYNGGGVGSFASYYVSNGSLIYISADSYNSSSYAQNGSVILQSLTYNSTVSPPSVIGLSGGLAYTEGGNCVTNSWGADRNYNSPVTAIKVLFSSGNIVSGTFSLYSIAS